MSSIASDSKCPLLERIHYQSSLTKGSKIAVMGPQLETAYNPPPYEHRTNSVARWSACNRSANSVPTFPTAFIKRGPVYFLPVLPDCSEHSVSHKMPKRKNADTCATPVRNRKRSYQKNISPHALGELQDYNERPFPPLYTALARWTLCALPVARTCGKLNCIPVASG